MMPIIQKTRAALAEVFSRKMAPRVLTRAQEEGLARQWGRLNLLSVVRYVPKTPVFVHCHECRWPVSPSRRRMWIGTVTGLDTGKQQMSATEEQMQRICEGVRRHMGAA